MVEKEEKYDVDNANTDLQELEGVITVTHT